MSKCTTYVDNALDLAEDSGDRLADERNSLEETGLADEDVEQNLVDTDKLFLIVSHFIVQEALVVLTSRKASKIASESAPAGTGGIPCIWAIEVVAVVTMSVKPTMIWGNGPWPMIIKGPLIIVML